MAYESPFPDKTIRQHLALQSLDELADWMAGVGPGSPNDQTAKAEFLRRQTLLQQETTRAGQEAAQAAKDTAKFTQDNARYMLWSVIVLAVSALITAVVTIALAFVHHGGG